MGIYGEDNGWPEIEKANIVVTEKNTLVVGSILQRFAGRSCSSGYFSTLMEYIINDDALFQGGS